MPSDRLDLRVVARFLDALVGRDGAARPLSRARLQVAARVNYDIYRTYEATLVARGLLALEGEPATVTLTARGAEVRQRLLRLLADVLGSGGSGSL
jgi:predicted transcriptional regulator